MDENSDYVRQSYPTWAEFLKERAIDTPELDPFAQLQALAPQPFVPKGNSPVGYRQSGLCRDDILVGDGLVERAGTFLIAGPSGIGKSSLGMQLGCYWACGQPAFDLNPTRELRAVMMQHEDSANDLYRMSAVAETAGLSPELIHKNFWIETVRGKVGAEAVRIARELVQWHKADLLLMNPLSAFHDGDISKNQDNIRFLYGELGALLDELRISFGAIHHKGKPPRNGKKGEDVYHEVMYDILGGAMLTGFFRAIITVSPLPNSPVYRFTVAKRFEHSGWPEPNQHFKWHPDKTKRLWVPADAVDVNVAKQCSGKSLAHLRKLVPVTGTIDIKILENQMSNAGFKQREQRALIAEALSDTTPDDLRLYKWHIHNPNGQPNVAISRFEQSYEDTPAGVKEARLKEKQARKQAPKI